MEGEVITLPQRLGYKPQKDLDFVERLIRTILKYPKSCDEIWIASDYGFPALKAARNNMEPLQEVAAKFREVGITVSLQISNSIGHGDYNSKWDFSGVIYEGSEMEHLVGEDGGVSKYCFCWNGKNFREYILDTVKIYAELRPHIIWIDDDLRPESHSAAMQCCFCPDCLSKFNSLYETSFTREELVYEINYGNLIWRERWIAFVRQGMHDFTYDLCRSMLAVSPDSKFGLQHTNHGGYVGNDQSYMLDAMKKASGKMPLTRPGIGGYDDHDPNNLLHKMRDIKWENTQIPDYVSERVAEIENLPFVAYGKTPYGTALETALYLAAGCTDVCYSMTMSDHEPMEWHEKEFMLLSKGRPYFEKLSEYSRRSCENGITIFTPKDMWKRPLTVGKDKAFSWKAEYYHTGMELMRIAIPLSYDTKNASAYLLHEDNAEIMTERDLCFLTGKPVITSGVAIDVLTQRGFGEQLGFSVEKLDPYLFFEEYTNHAVNGKPYSHLWQYSFAKGGVYQIIEGNNVEAIGKYATDSITTPFGSEKYPYGISAAIIAMQGAKWAVFGKGLWNMNVSFDRRNQILNAVEYIGARLGAKLKTPQQAVLLPRVSKINGKTVSVSIINCTIGPTGLMTLELRNPTGMNFNYMGLDGTVCHEIRAVTNNGICEIQIPSIEAWSSGTLFIE